MRLVVDREGGVWPERHPELLRGLSVMASPEALRDFVARNMGYVTLHRTDASIAVRCNPRLVSDAALAQTVLTLGGWAPRRVALGLLAHGGWRHEIVAGDRAPSRLSRAVAEAQQSHTPALQRRTLDRRELGRFAAQPLLETLEAWEAARAGTAPIAQFLERLAFGRYVVAELHPDERQLYVKSVGRELEIASHFPPNARRLVAQHPDKTYGQWIARHYLEAMIEGVHVFDEIEASIELGRNDRRRHHYLRLLLPLRRGLLLSASVAA